jgi:soluble lytic murein transglycosylase-like protein
MGVMAVVAAVSAPAQSHAEALYECTDPSGVVSYTNAPTDTRCRVYGGGEYGGPRVLRAARPRTVVDRERTSGEPGAWRGAEPYREIVAEAARRYRVPVELILAVMRAESGFNTLAISPRGAMGLMQLMPDTAGELGVTNAFDPWQNILGGAAYLRQLANLFNGDMVRIVAAYNSGPASVQRHGPIPPFDETRAYVPRVIRYYFELKQRGAGARSLAVR